MLSRSCMPDEQTDFRPAEASRPYHTQKQRQKRRTYKSQQQKRVQHEQKTPNSCKLSDAYFIAYIYLNSL